MLHRFVFLAFLLPFAFCKNRSTDATAIASSGQTPPQDFLDFYEKFHGDSIFQIEHIQWPLTGEASPPVLDSVQVKKNPMLWQKEAWRMHRPIESNGSNLKREWQLLGQVMVIERVRESTTGLFIERRFAKSIAGEWELVFYSDF